MDKEIIVSMLQTIKETAAIGPEEDEYYPGERIVYALDRGLLQRSDDGNFLLSPKAEELLSGKLEWGNL